MSHHDAALIAAIAYITSQLNDGAAEKCSREEQATLIIWISMRKLQCGDDIQGRIYPVFQILELGI